MFWILILGLLGFSIIAAFRGINLVNWTLGMALVLVGFAVLPMCQRWQSFLCQYCLQPSQYR